METLQQQRTDKYKYITVIKAHGGRDDQKKVQVQVTHVQSDDLKKVQHDVQVIYESPYDQQEKKVKLRAVLQAKHDFLPCAECLTVRYFAVFLRRPNWSISLTSTSSRSS